MQIVKVYNAHTNELLGIYPDSWVFVQTDYTTIFDCSITAKDQQQRNFVGGNWIARFTGDVITVEEKQDQAKPEVPHESS